jgi:hypothetical protein
MSSLHSGTRDMPKVWTVVQTYINIVKRKPFIVKGIKL